MQKFEKFMEKYFVPLANKLNSNKIVAAIRDAFILNFPLIMTASVILLLNFVVFCLYLLPGSKLDILKGKCTDPLFFLISRLT